MMIPDTDATVLTGPERRRRWSIEQKLAIVAEMMRPGARAAVVARRYGFSTGLLYTWRRLVLTGELSVPSAATPGFVPVCVGPPAMAPVVPSASSGEMVLALPGDRRLHLGRDVDAEALRRVLAVLEGR